MCYFLRKETGEIEQNRSGQVLRSPNSRIRKTIGPSARENLNNRRSRFCQNLLATRGSRLLAGILRQKYIYKNVNGAFFVFFLIDEFAL